MSEFKTQTVVGAGGSVTVQGLPFPAGEPVEVTVTPTPPTASASVPLTGSVLRYDDPTGPVVAADWQAAR